MPQAMTPRRPASDRRLWSAVLGAAQQLGLLVGEVLVLDARVGRAAASSLRISRVGLSGFCGRGSRVATAERLCARRVTRRTITGSLSSLGQLEGLDRQVVALLLVARLEAGDEGELGVDAAVLLVLAGVHPRVVRDRQHEAAVGAGHRRVHERVGGHVEADVLHADQRPLAGPAHAERLFVGHLLVGAPEGVDARRCPGSAARRTRRSRWTGCRGSRRRRSGRRGSRPGRSPRRREGPHAPSLRPPLEVILDGPGG